MAEKDESVREGANKFSQRQAIGISAKSFKDYVEPPSAPVYEPNEGIAWAVGGMIFVLVYCTAGISGGHINPAVTFGLLLARKLSVPRAVFYMVMQCLGAICGAGMVKGFQASSFEMLGGGVNVVNPGYSKATGLGAEIIGTFVLVYTVFSATDAKRSARDSHVPVSKLNIILFLCILVWARLRTRAVILL